MIKKYVLLLLFTMGLSASENPKFRVLRCPRCDFVVTVPAEDATDMCRAHERESHLLKNKGYGFLMLFKIVHGLETDKAACAKFNELCVHQPGYMDSSEV